MRGRLTRFTKSTPFGLAAGLALLCLCVRLDTGPDAASIIVTSALVMWAALWTSR